MKQWAPIPISEIEKVDNDRRLIDTPASTLDGFAYAWLKSDRGAPLSQRQLAQWANWSKRKAADVLNAVQQAEKEWADQKRTKTAPAVGVQNGPPKSNYSAQLEESPDQKRTTNGPDPDQKRTDRARPYLHNNNTTTVISNVGINSDHTPAEPEQTKPKKQRARGQNIGTEATRALWSTLNERRKDRRKGARALKLTPEINRTLKEALSYAAPDEILHAYEWFTTAYAARWWQDHECDLPTFCRKKHIGQFINNAAEWTREADTQTNTGQDILDLDDSQFDEHGNIIAFQPNRSGTNGNE